MLFFYYSRVAVSLLDAGLHTRLPHPTKSQPSEKIPQRVAFASTKHHKLHTKSSFIATTPPLTTKPLHKTTTTMPSATSPNTHTEPSPSPPPQAPTATLPGPRATAFINLYNSALNSTLSSISYETFSECFPLIAAQAPGALKAMHESVVSRLGGFAREEFEVILKERSVVSRLNELEDRIAEGRRRRARAVGGEEEEEVPIP